MTAITKTQLDNVASDANSFASVINDGPSPGTVTTRTGRVLKTLSAVQVQVEDAVDVIAPLVAGILPTCVLSATTASPPGSPSAGDAYIVPVGGGVAWGATEGTMIVRNSANTNWDAVIVLPGHQVTAADTGAVYRFGGNSGVFYETHVSLGAAPSLSTAISAAGSDVWLEGDVDVSLSADLSASTANYRYKGGKITRGSHAVTLASIEGPSSAELFDAAGTGLVTFSRTARIDVRAFGVKGDGTTDDANALSQALLSAKASKAVLFGNNSLLCNLKSQIIIPPNIIFNADGLCLTPDATLTSNALAVVDGAQAGYVGELRGEINGLHLLQPLTSNHADTSKNVDGLQLGSTNGAYQIKISDLDVQGFRYSLVVKGPNVYIIDFYNIILANGWKRLISHDSGSNTGERFAFHGSTLANCNNPSFDGTALFISSTTTNAPDYSFHGTSFDYNDVSIDMSQGKVGCFGCHFEKNNNNPHLKMTKTGGKFAPRFEAHGGQLTGGPGVVSWSGIPTEDTDGCAALITTTGGDATIIVQGVECGNFITTSSPGSPPAYKTEIVKNTDGSANRVVDIRPVLSSGASTSSALPPTLSNSLNDIYLGASGSTTGWDTTNIGGGNAVAADTTAGKFQAPDSGGRKITCASGNSGSIFQTVNVAGKKRVIAKAWIATDTTFTSGEVDIRLQFYSSKGDLISDQTSARTMTATNAGPTEISTDIPVPTGAYTVKVNIHWGSLPSGGIFWTSNEHVWTW